MSARYAEALAPADGDPGARVRAPSPRCAERAHAAFAGSATLHEAPLPVELRARTVALVQGLHPIAHKVALRLDSIWYAHDIPGAEARFVPCVGDDGDAGLVVLDAHSSLPATAKDVDVPRLYWDRLGVTPAGEEPSDEPAPPERHGLRYVLLHELGHALSLLAGEFHVDSSGQFDVGRWDGFVGFSWRGTLPRARGRPLHEAGGLVPTKLALGDWRRLRTVLESEPSWLAPGHDSLTPTPTGWLAAGYGAAGNHRQAQLCEMVRTLPRAGFVTPTAATAPTEDYAETFAHAILAAEGHLLPEQLVVLTPSGCPSSAWRHPPYFAPGVSAKRAYLERMLGL
jgi:hypothetical protein